MKRITKWVFSASLFLLPAGLFPADLTSAFIQDDSTLRITIKDSWLTGTPAAVLRNRPFVRNLPGGAPVQVRSEVRNNDFSVILSRERNGTFPGWAQGSWIYTRNRGTGAPLRIRVFLRSDPQMFVQFRPFGSDKSQIDVVIYDAYVVRGLPIGISFDRLLTIPVEEALAAAGNRFPRRYFDPDPRLYRNIYLSGNNNNFVTRVRSALGSLNYEDDGALDEQGRYVLIESLRPQRDPAGLNCSGFAKWVVDGMLRPITGRRLAIAPLKAPVTPRTSSLAANYENRDPLFGLDWTRNLALEAARVLRSPAFATVENVEVRMETFASLIDRSGGGASIKSYPGFLRNAGFSVEGLRPLLYTLAINEPGYLYLVSVSREERSELPLRHHYHVAVLIPYFNEFGNFQTVVFESAAETDLAGFIRRHPQALVNLVRIPVEGVFDP
ncbi:MAG: hypothetical protein FWG27_07960 [Treponema sp.]|nr:hypothetical protein [Treponema sp.]